MTRPSYMRERMTATARPSRSRQTTAMARPQRTTATARRARLRRTRVTAHRARRRRRTRASSARAAAAATAAHARGGTLDPLGDALWQAVGDRDLARVSELLARGADVNMVCPDNWVRAECLARASAASGARCCTTQRCVGDLAIFRALVAAGADPERRRSVAWRPNGGVGGRGNAPLHAAVMYGRSRSHASCSTRCASTSTSRASRATLRSTSPLSSTGPRSSRCCCAAARAPTCSRAMRNRSRARGGQAGPRARAAGRRARAL